MSSDEALTLLLTWATGHGTFLSKNLRFKPIVEGNLGCFYEGNQTQDGELDGNQIKLPVKLAITLQNAIKLFGDGFQTIAEKSSNTNSLLKLYLCREITTDYIEKSFFKPYLEALPTLGQINSPYTWLELDKALLKGSNLGSSLSDNLALIIEEWWQVINLLPESVPKPPNHFVNMKFYYEYKFYKDDDFHNYFINDYDLENWTGFANYLWASLILKSRSFPAYLLQETTKDTKFKQDEAMLLPVIDLLNHDPRAKVNWAVSEDGFFNFKSDSVVPNQQLFNNYGMKGNEELLLAYGFCLQDNGADSAALKIKIPEQLVKKIEEFGIKIPTIDDYTTSVVRGNGGEMSTYDDGLLFFVTETNLPENLVQVFEYLVKNEWETKITLRMKLHGLNQLRGAIESKLLLLNVPNGTSDNAKNVKIYIESQQRIFRATIKTIKRMEKQLLTQHKNQLISLKNVYKKDVKLAQSLLLTFGFTSYEQILESQFQDQCWLLFLIRCYNRDEYVSSDGDEDGDPDNYLPLWIKQYFNKVVVSSTVSAQQVVNYKDIYENLIPPLNKAVPEIYNRGKWGVEELVHSATLLDRIGFVRGQEQDCILVVPEN
jgi:hypothetical protein